MKDFKDSYEQKKWESAVASHARATRALDHLATLPDVEKHVEFWQQVKTDSEKRYPALRAKEPGA